MFLSVVIPVYNSETTLEQTVRSLFAQTSHDFEIIAVNDGSRDSSGEILSQLKEESPVRFVIISQENQGLSAARNHGLARVRGQYVYFLDADDFVEPCLVEHAKQHLESEEIDVLIFDMDFYHHIEERFIPRTTTEFAPENFGEARVPMDFHTCPSRLFESFHNWVWNKIYRTGFLQDEGLFFGRSVCTEDFPFTAWALIRAQKLLYLDEVLVHYRIFRGDSAMDRRDTHPLDMVETFIDFRQRLMQTGYYQEVEEAFVRWTLMGLFSNINNFQTPEAYQTITDFLSRGGWRMLGLESCKQSYIEESGWELPYHLLHDRGALYYARWDKRMVERHRDELFQELRSIQQELDQVKQELTKLQEELEQTRKESAERIDYLETRFEHRLGRKIFAPLRALKDALDNRRAKAATSDASEEEGPECAALENESTSIQDMQDNTPVSDFVSEHGSTAGEQATAACKKLEQSASKDKDQGTPEVAVNSEALPAEEALPAKDTPKTPKISNSDLTDPRSLETLEISAPNSADANSPDPAESNNSATQEK